MSGTDELQWLMNWYAAQCDDEWEHRWGVEIGTLDNPGWSLRVDLVGTDLEGREFPRLARGLESEASWSVCWTEKDRFHAACGAKDLAEVLGTFRRWADSGPSPLAGEGGGEADG